jgi:subtilisin family serine protease
MVGRAESLAAIRAAGYSVISARQLGALNETLARIRVNEGESVERTLVALRALAPNADIAPNHVFRPSQSVAVTAAMNSDANVANNPTARAPKSLTAQIGIIDTGADNSWSELTDSVVRTQGFADGGYTARIHGSVVSQIAVTQGARLAVADVFGVDGDNQLIAPAEAIARAIDWLLGNRVRLMNVSIEGPDNVVLAHVIRRAIAQGAVIVAAAGNGGPAAAPVYPAAYPNVIAVTAVDEQGRIYPRANRGGYIAFAARGVRVPVPSHGTSAPATVSGTSFAAPLVTAEIARRYGESRRNDIASVIVAMQREAIDLGAPGRDSIFGWGLIAPPRAVSAMTH